MRRGVAVIAIGEPAALAAAGCVASIREHAPDLEIVVYGDRAVTDAGAVEVAPQGLALPWAARLCKLTLDSLTPFHQTVYLDADTVLTTSIDPVFAILDDGWDWVIAPSTMQGLDAFTNCSAVERESASSRHGGEALAYQCGAFAWQQGAGAAALFDAWRKEWRGREDQAAFRRALDRCPTRMWTMAWSWHAPAGRGAAIEHRFGALRTASLR